MQKLRGTRAVVQRAADAADAAERAAVAFTSRHGVTILRVAVAIVWRSRCERVYGNPARA